MGVLNAYYSWCDPRWGRLTAVTKLKLSFRRDRRSVFDVHGVRRVMCRKLGCQRTHRKEEEKELCFWKALSQLFCWSKVQVVVDEKVEDIGKKVDEKVKSVPEGREILFWLIRVHLL